MNEKTQQAIGVDTAHCEECAENGKGNEWCWRGPNAYKQGEQHQKQTGHTVWYDHDPDATS